jgi:hypothetical protein
LFQKEIIKKLNFLACKTISNKLLTSNNDPRTYSNPFIVPAVMKRGFVLGLKLVEIWRQSDTFQALGN